MGYENSNGATLCDFGYCDEPMGAAKPSTAPSKRGLVTKALPRFRCGAVITGWASRVGYVPHDMRLVIVHKSATPGVMGLMAKSIRIPASVVGSRGQYAYTVPGGRDYTLFVEGTCHGLPMRGPSVHITRLTRDTIVGLQAPKCAGPMSATKATR